MPARNAIKTYSDGSYYHLYNRGADKKEIFLEQQDFAVFLSYLKAYLLPKDIINLQLTINSKSSTISEKDKALKLLKLKNFSDEISLLCYALLPNHFHFLIKQKTDHGIDHFIRALGTRYTSYFNRKYHRIGHLYQGVYKAVIIESEEQLLHLSRYIHLNPFRKLGLDSNEWEKITWPFSLPDFIGIRKTSWVKNEDILTYFNLSNSNNSYSSFMGMSQELENVSSLLIDIDDE